MNDIKEILDVRKYKVGYHVVTYMVDGSQYGSRDFKMRTAFTNDNLEYIGDPKFAWRLYNKYGLRNLQSMKGREPIENRTIDQEAKRLLLGDFMRDYSSSPPCSIGFNPEEQKWYGWSHRAIYGFGIGSTVTKDHLAYTPKNKEDFIESEMRFWDEDYHKNVYFAGEDTRDGLKGAWIKWTVADDVPNEAMRGKIDGVFCPYPDEWGRGEWTAQTLEDAKQMAIDFSEGVS